MKLYIKIYLGDNIFLFIFLDEVNVPKSSEKYTKRYYRLPVDKSFLGDDMIIGGFLQSTIKKNYAKYIPEYFYFDLLF